MAAHRHGEVYHVIPVVFVILLAPVEELRVVPVVWRCPDFRQPLRNKRTQAVPHRKSSW